MQNAPERKHAKRLRLTKTDGVAGSQVLSIAAARMRRARRAAAKRPLPPELSGLDLRPIDLERMTASAREHFWFNLNRYARRLYGRASDLSALEYAQPDSPVTGDHIQAAELERMRGVKRAERNDLGLTFLLDALQILGAAVCGALATKPDLMGGSGALPLSLALAATVAVFLARELVTARASA